MDPTQSEAYIKAQNELHDLFHEISVDGHVSSKELLNSLLPFTAGSARKDVQFLAQELSRKQKSMDEAEFVRVIWKKMYLKHTAILQRSMTPLKDQQPKEQEREKDQSEEEILRRIHAKVLSQKEATNTRMNDEANNWNFPLSHVIVSLKRRRQLEQFASYYSSRGISGAENLTTTTTTATANATATSTSQRTSRIIHTQKKSLSSSRSKKQGTCDSTSAVEKQPSVVHSSHTTSHDHVVAQESIRQLRARKSPLYEVVAYAFDSKTRAMKYQRILPDLTWVQLKSSRICCLVVTRETGIHTIASSTFLEQIKQWIEVKETNELDTTNQLLVQTKLECGNKFKAFLTQVATGYGTFLGASSKKIFQWGHVGGNGFHEEDEEIQANNQQKDIDQLKRDFSNQLITENCCGLMGGKPLSQQSHNAFEFTGAKDLACGDGFSLCLTRTGEIFTWGKKSIRMTKKSVGTAATMASIYPMKISWNEKIETIACGAHHAILVTVSKKAYSWGNSNVFGQLGHGTFSSCETPTMIQTVGLVLDVTCGEDHSVLLDNDGAVWTFGNNWQGQLGHDTSIYGCFPEPKQILLPGSARVYLITATNRTTAVVTTNGQVFSWGECIPEGKESICGIVTRWKPQILKTEHDVSVRFQSIAISGGLILLTRHASSSSPPHQ